MMKHILSVLIRGLLFVAMATAPLGAQVILSPDFGEPLSEHHKRSMDLAFGEGKWRHMDLYSPDIDTLLAPKVSFIYLECSDQYFGNLRSFLSVYGSRLEEWVSKGNILYVNGGQPYGEEILLGFGGVEINYVDARDTMEVVAGSHRMFAGPYGPRAQKFWMNHPYGALRTVVKGRGLKPLMTSVASRSEVLLAEKPWGKGTLIVGTLGSPNHAIPQIEFTNLEANILSLKNIPLPVNALLKPLAQAVSKPQGAQPITVSLKSYGTTALTEALVHWQVDGVVQTPFKWTKGLAAYETAVVPTDSFAIGNFVFERAKKYELKVWLSTLNGTVAVVDPDTLSQTIYTAMAGNYVVGSDTSDYASLEEAVAAINTIGVVGPTTFLLLEGGHVLNSEIGAILGTSATNTITFQSLNGDSSTTYIYRSEYGNATLMLNGASYLTFKNLNISWTSQVYSTGYAVYLHDNCHHIAFHNNLIVANYYNSMSNAASAIYFLSTEHQYHDIVFKNNRIHRGSYGIYAFASSSNYEDTFKDITIENNDFTDQFSAGMYVGRHTGLKIHQNRIAMGSYVQNYQGLYVQQVRDFSITNNHVYVHVFGQGIYLSSTQASEGKRSSIFNNFVYADGTARVVGLYLSDCHGLSIYHNTFNINNTSPESAGFMLEGAYTDLYLYNNNFCVRGPGWAAYCSNVNSISSSLNSDHNNFYSRGPELFNMATYKLKGLADWTAMWQRDSNSVSVNAAFVPDNGYKANKGLLDGTGKPLPEVAQDFEGEARDAQHPDIGADEFVYAGLDLQLQSLSVPTTPFAAGNHALKVKVYNAGQVSVSSFRVAINFNGVAMANIPWTGVLPKGESLELNLGNFNFLPLLANSISISLEAPNGGTDMDASDNVITKGGLYAALAAGAYTIGGTAPSFESFYQVQSQLHKGGLLGPVTFNVREGDYNEHLSLSEIPGLGKDASIVFQSELRDSSKVVLHYGNQVYYDSSYVLMLANVSYVTVRDLSFKAEGNNSYGNVVVLKGTNSHITFSNNAFIGKKNLQGGTYDNDLVFILQTGTHGDIVFDNNLLLDGSFGFNIQARGVQPVSRIILKGNQLKDQTSYGMDLDGLSYIQVVGNKITSSSSYYDYRAVSLTNGKDGSQILQNSIFAVQGIGIFINDVYPSDTSELKIANNLVKMQGTTAVRALVMRYINRVKIYHNTFVVNTAAPEAYATYIYSVNNVLELFNNHIVNTKGGYALYYLSESDHAKVNADYNNYYVTGNKLIQPSNSASGAKLTMTLAAWQTYSGKDMHSSTHNPLFDTLTYQPTQSRVNGTALPVSWIKQDLLGNVRSSFPDIGALEFNATGLNVTAVKFALSEERFEAGVRPLTLVVRNNGDVPVTSFKVKWKVDGALQSDFVWSGTLGGELSDTIVLRNFDFKIGALHAFEFLVTEPNGLLDIDSTDNKIIVSNVGAALKGVYTIGGEQPDFVSFNAAAKVLNQKGVVGKVTFNVRPGTYAEQVRLGPLPGVDQDQGVVFQAENGDKASVILTYFAPNTTNNYTVLLDSSKYVTLKSLTIRSENKSYSTVLAMRNGTAYNTIIGNNLMAPVDASSSNVYVSTLQSGTLAWRSNHSNLFEANEIWNGAAGLVIQHNYPESNRDKGNIVRNNTFRQQRNDGISMRYQESPQIVGNDIKSASNNYYTGIELNNCYRALLVSKNKVVVNNGNRCIYLGSCSNNDTAPSLIVNNFCTLKGNNAGVALGIYSCVDIQVYHNTVFNTDLGPDAKAFESLYGSRNSIVNNIFVSKGAGVAANYGDVGNAERIDYNNYFATSDILFAGSPTLEEWQTKQRVDSHSVSMNPLFVSDTNLRALEFNLNTLGTPLDKVLDDIDGELRSTVHPALGADEILPLAIDAGVYRVVSPVIPFASGAHTVTVSLRSYGTDVLKTATLNWSLNGVLQAPIAWSGNLSKGDTALLSLPQVTFMSNMAYTVKLWTSAPNSLSDPQPMNDTLVWGPIYPALKGTYTIGGTAPDFATIAAAVTALSRGGVADSVRFNIRKGSYVESLTIPAIPYSKSRHMVVFQSETGLASDVEIKSVGTSTANYVIKIEDADGVTFKNLSLRNTSTSYGRVVHIGSSSNEITFDGVVFNGEASTTFNNQDQALLVVISEALSNSGLQVLNSTFNKGAYAIYCRGANSTRPQIGTLIRGNTFNDFYSYAVYMDQQESILLQNNSFKSNSMYSGLTGIVVSGSKKVTISGNAFKFNNGGVAIALSSLIEDASTPHVVANNFISITGGETAWGIRSTYTDYVNFYHNTIIIDANTQTQYFSAFYLWGKGLKLFNNNLNIVKKGYFIYIASAVNTTLTSNYNNFYTPGTYMMHHQDDVIGLAKWKQLTNQDHLSVSVNPNFRSAGDACFGNNLLNDRVPLIKGIEQDMNGKVRKSMTDIGACELDPSGVDAALLEIQNPVKPIATPVQEVTTVLYNNGSETLSSVRIHWTVNGVTQPSVDWNGSLLTQKSVVVSLGSYTLERLKSYQVKAWTAAPNGVEDALVVNDTIQRAPIAMALSGEYTIGGATADYPNFTKAVEALHLHGVVGPVVFKANNGIYNERLLLEKIEGVSASNPITFTSLAQDSTKVTINYSSTSSDQNYVVWLKGSSFVTFNKMTLKALNATYAKVLNLSEGTGNITVKGCILSGKPYNYYGEQHLIMSAGVSTGNSFVGNVFLDGSYGLYLNGTSTAWQTNEIRNNTFYTQNVKGICLSYQNKLIVERNVFTPLSTSSDYAAIHLTQVKEGLQVSNNRALLPGTQSIGIYLNSVVGTAELPALVYNNFTNHLKPDNNTGIYVDFSKFVGLYHNSVRIDGTATTLKEALKIHAGDHIDVKNNIFAHFGKGRAVEITGNPTALLSDYNDLFTTGTVMVIKGTSSYSSLEAYQQAAGVERSSKSVDPNFVVVGQAHVKQANLDGAATPIAYVKEDFEGHARHADHPDIGADEFGAGLITNDLGIVSVLSPINGCKLDGPQYLAVKLQNFGVDTLSNMSVHYVLNDTLHVEERLENVSIKGGQAYNYTFKTPVVMDRHDIYSFDIYTSLPEDSNPINDTIFNHTIQHFPIAVAYAGKDTLICQDQPYGVVGNGGARYEWYLLGSNYIHSNNRGFTTRLSQKATYVLKSFNSSECFAFDTVTVDVSPLPTMPTISSKGAFESICVSDTITLSSNILKNIVWFNGDTTQSVKVTNSGRYSLTHVNPTTGCSNTTTVSVNKPEVPQFNSTPLICPGTEAVLSLVGTSNVSSYLWSTGATTSSITVKPNAPTLYKVKVIMNDGCELERSITVRTRIPGALPKITALTGDSSICMGAYTQLRVEGVANEFIWSTGAKGSSINVSPTARTQYTVTATGDYCNPNSVSASMVVDILPGPTQAPIIVATGSSSLSFCDASEITLNSSDYSESIVWSTGETTPSIKVYTQGIYSLSHVSKYGCSKKSSVKIEDPSAPYITGKKELCKGQSTTLTVVNGYSFRWSTGATGNSITVSPDSTTDYTVSIVNREGCTYTQKVRVIIYEVPVISSVSADTTICEGSAIVLKVNGKAKEFMWTSGQIGNTIKVVPTKSTVYGVRATNGCPEQSTNDYLNVAVKVLPRPVAAAIVQGDSIAICSGKSIQLSSSLADSIVWSTGEHIQHITVKDTGVYRLTRFNAYGCTVSNEIKVAYPNRAHIVVDEGFATICKGDQAKLSLKNGQNYLWSTGAKTASIWVSPDVNTTYKVTGQNALGCNYLDSILIKVVAPIAPDVPGNILPTDRKTDLSLPLTLSWSPATNASHYDIYLWDEGSEMPMNPVVKNTEQILYRIEKGLDFGKRYYWKINAKNSCKETQGPVQVMELRHLPDLTVQNVLVPASAFSGQQIQVSWEVKNKGLGRTMAKEYWNDKIYLSSDSIFQANLDLHIGGMANKTSLDTGQSYIASTLVKLPEGIGGTYYVFVVSNGDSVAKELIKGNNTARNKRYLLIQLTPPPDLRVTAVNSLTNVFSGQTLDLTWAVTNKGEGGTKVSGWTDKVYFTADSILRVSAALELGVYPHLGILEPKGYYEQLQKVTLPHGIFGKFFIHVLTDAEDMVFEHAYNNNNEGRSPAITVTLLPPSDLVPEVLSSPGAVSNGDKVQMRWSVKNQGGSATNVTSWKDEVYMYTKPVLDLSQAVLVGSRINAAGLGLGANYEAVASITVPKTMSGTCYLFVVSDRENLVFEHNQKANNTSKSMAIMVNSPDLIVDKLTVLTSPVKSGAPVRLRWCLKNKGAGVLHPSSWTESLAFKASVVYDSSKIWSQANFPVTTTVPLSSGDSLIFERALTLTEGVSGTWYLVAKTNVGNNLYEGQGGNLNNTLNLPIAIQLAASPDLTIAKLSAKSDTAYTGTRWPLRLQIKNIGETSVKDSIWVDKVYMSTSPILGKDTVLLGGARARFVLQKDSSYIYDVEVPIPANLELGSYFFHVFTDANNNIYEHNGENNNRKVYGPVSVKYGVGPDLELSVVHAPDTALSGVSYPLKWQVSNKGKVATLATWSDVLYLSKDTVWEPLKDVLLVSKSARRNLDTNAYYVQDVSVTLPEAVAGNYYWIVVTDYNTSGKPFVESGDRNRANNVKIIPVHVRLNTAPDLALGNLQVPDEAVAGQPITIEYTVTNQGKASTRPQKWTDKVYLSTDFQIDKNDRVLVTIQRTDTLMVGAYYTQREEVVVPLVETGNYIILVKTDSDDKQYEDSLEANNIGYNAIYIQRPLPADLVVSEVRAEKDQYLAGDPLKLSWTITNKGVNPVVGIEEDQFYLSKNNTWDLDDVFLGQVRTSLNIAPNESKSLQHTFVLNQASVGDYYIVARTDARNQIPETNELNNETASTKTVLVDVEELVLNQPDTTMLAHEGSLCYKVVVPDSLANKTLLVELFAENTINHNELYIRYGEAPTRNRYDAAFGRPFAGSQEVIIPEMRPGTYYVLVYGQNERQETQSVQLKASLLHFGIRSVKTNVGGDLGPVTTCIEGAKFKTTTQFFLYKNNVPLEASKVYYISPTKVFATFDLSHAPLGYYDVLARDSSEEVDAMLLSGFRVEKATEPSLEVDLEHPLATRVGNIVPIEVRFANAGNIDLPMPKRAVLFTGAKLPVALSVEELKYLQTSLLMEFAEPEGPPGILRPGAMSTQIFYVHALTHIKLKLLNK